MFAKEVYIAYNYFMKEPTKEKIEWDKKKIIVFVIFLLILLVGLYKLKAVVLDQNSQPVSKNQTSFKKDVKSASIDNSGAQSIKKSVQDEVSKLKSEAQNINVVDIATSSPQVQKVINDLKALQEFPNNQLKQTCEKICSGL